MRPKPTAFVELAMKNESIPVQDSGCIVTHHTHLPNVASRGLKQPTNRSVGGNFLKTTKSETRSDCLSLGRELGCDPLGQPVVSVPI